jgi:hypothetical protein
MPLIVEDGTGIEDANTYIGLVEAREIAAMRGITLSVDDPELTAQLVVSADRIGSYENRFSGERATSDQGLSYPRSRSTRFCKIYPDDKIPKELKLAQVVLAGFLESGIEVWASPINEGVTREKVGPIEIEYAEAIIATGIENPYLAQIEAILAPLFIPIFINFLLSR